MKTFLNFRNLPQLFQQLYIIGVVCIQIAARRGEKALPVPAYAVFHLFLTGRMSEIRRRSSHIMDISFKLLLLCDLLRFFYQRIMTSHLYDSSLVEGQCTEAASSETPAAAGQAETDLGKLQGTPPATS